MNRKENYYHLQYYQNKARVLAQKYYKYQNIVKYLIIVISILCVVIDNKCAWIFILLSCILEIIMQFLGKKGMDYHKKNRVAVQELLFEDSFKNIQDTSVYESLMSDEALMKEYDEEKVNKSYYNTIETEGSKRFAFNMAESILYTKILFAKYEKFKWKETIVLFFGCVILIIVAFIFINDDTRYLIVSPITTILSILLYGEFETYVDLVESNKGFEIIDNSLKMMLNNGDFDEFRLYKIYVDYNLLTRETIPVPSRIYLKQRDSIHKIWQTRYVEIQRINNERLSKEIDFMKNVRISDEFSYLHKEKIKYIVSIIRKTIEREFRECESIFVERIGSFSRSFILQLTFLQKNKKIKIIAKKFSTASEYTRAIQLLEILNRIDMKHYPDYIESSELREEFIIAYYHINTQVQVEYQRLDEILMENRWEEYKDYYGEQLKKALTFNYYALQNALLLEIVPFEKTKIISELKAKRPGSYIIDLSWISRLDPSGKFEYNEQCLKDNSCGEKFILASKLGRQRIELLNWNDNHKVVGNIYYKEVRYIVFLPVTEAYAPNNYIDIDFREIVDYKITYTTEKYLECFLSLKLNSILSEDFDEIYRLLLGDSENWKLCHNDFHAKNIFLSKANFKIIDIENIGFSTPYADVCRLQISFLYFHSKKKNNRKIIEDFFGTFVGKEAKYDDTKWIISLKEEFEKLSYKDFEKEEYELTLLLEILMQIYYSICSDRKLTSEWIVGYNLLKKKILDR